MNSVKLKKYAQKLDMWSMLVITFGCLLSAFGYSVFIVPMDFFEGGVIGIGFLAKYIFDLPIGTVALIITYLIFIVGTKILGKGFGIKSVYATTIFNLMLDAFNHFKESIYPGPLSPDMLLNAFFGGILIGTGMGLVFYHGASTGGSDAFAQIMRWVKRIPIGRTLIIVDIVVLGFATFYATKAFGIEGLQKIMYSFVFIFIQIKVVDVVLNGLNANQRIMITTEKPDLIKDSVLASLSRGITVHKAMGGYSGKEKIILETIIGKKQVPEIRRIVSEIDQKAFVVIQDVHQVYGMGFEKLPQKEENIII